MKKILISATFALGITILYIISAYINLNEQAELKTLDLRQRFSEEASKTNKDIAIILVDEASLQSMKTIAGRWPWPRALWGDLVDFLSAGNAKLVLFDLIFSEPQVPRNSKGILGNDDSYLAEICSANSNVVHAVQLVNDLEDELNKTLLNRKMPQDFINKFSLKNVSVIDQKLLPKANNYYLPIPELYENSNYIGVVEFLSDNKYGSFLDSTYRRTHLVREYNGNYFPTLSFAAIKDYFDIKKIVIENNKIILNDKLQAPLMSDGTYLINMKKKFNSYSISGIFASIQKLKKGETENLILDPSEFDNKIVLIGTSAAGIEDLKSTSIGESIPGVFLHASIISNFLDKKFIYPVNKAIIAIIVFIFSLIVSLLILKSTSVILHNLIPFFIVFIYIFTTFFLFKHFLLWIDLVNPVLSIVLAYVGSYVYLSSTEGKEKRRTKKMLSQYVSPGVLAEVMKGKKKALTAEVGSKVELTVLFSDIRGFTSFSETTKPELVVEMLNYYLEHMVNIVFKYQGTLDKFIGDAVMAFWGAPVETENHARAGVLAAMEMRAKLLEINEYFKQKNYPEFQIGIGLHTGEVILGNIGSDKKLDYTIIGDNVNLSSRIEGLTKTYGCDILFTEKTFDQIGNDIPCRVIDLVKVKGKNKPIKILSPAPLSLIAEKSQIAFDYYLNREWQAAIGSFIELEKLLVNDVTAKMFIQRCKEYMENSPSTAWDGSYTMKTK